MRKLLVEEYRGELLECDYYGHICGITDDDRIVYSVGDMEFFAYYRSSAKPIQAIPVMKMGLKEKYNITDEEFTILTASHGGEENHIRAIEGIMRKTGFVEDDFICSPTYPNIAKAKEEVIKKGEKKSSKFHNCSGKHLGLMMLSKELGCNIEDYWKPEERVQQLILDYISEISTYPKEDIMIGIDGCGVPVFAMPLKYIAKSYLHLACPELIEDEDTRDAVNKITGMMNRYHTMVSGTNRLTSVLLEDDNIMAKVERRVCFALL